jgi:hypothetical protein
VRKPAQERLAHPEEPQRDAKKDPEGHELTTKFTEAREG